MKKSRRREGACIFVHELLDHKVRKSLFIFCDAIESMSIEICNRKTRNTIFKGSTKFKGKLFCSPQK